MGLFADALLLPTRLEAIAMIARQQQPGLVLNIIDGDSNVFQSGDGRDCGVAMGSAAAGILPIASHFHSICEATGISFNRGSFTSFFVNTFREALSEAPDDWEYMLNNWYTTKVDSTCPVVHGSNRSGETKGLNVTPFDRGTFDTTSSPNRYPFCGPGDILASDTWYIDGPGGGTFFPGKLRYDVAPYTGIYNGESVACNTEPVAKWKRHRRIYTVQAGDVGKPLGFHTSDSGQTIVAPVAILGQQLSVLNRLSGFGFDNMVAVGGQPLRHHVNQLNQPRFIDHARNKIKMHMRLAQEKGIPFHILVHYQGGPNDRNDTSTQSVGIKRGAAGVGSTGDGYYDNLTAYYWWYREMLSGVPGFDFENNFRMHLQVAPWDSGVGSSDTSQDPYRRASHSFAKAYPGVVYSETLKLWRSYSEALAYKIDANHMTGHGQTVCMYRFFQEMLDANPVR